MKKQRKTIIVLAIAAAISLSYTAAKTWAADSGDASETVAGKAREIMAGMYPFLRLPQAHRLHYPSAYICFDGKIHQTDDRGIWMTEGNEEVGVELKEPNCKASPFSSFVAVTVETTGTAKENMDSIINRYNATIKQVTQQWVRIRLDAGHRDNSQLIRIHWIAVESRDVSMVSTVAIACSGVPRWSERTRRIMPGRTSSFLIMAKF